MTDMAQFISLEALEQLMGETLRSVPYDRSSFFVGADFGKADARTMACLGQQWPDTALGMKNAQSLTINRLAPHLYGGRQQGKTATMKLSKAEQKRAEDNAARYKAQVAQQIEQEAAGERLKQAAIESRNAKLEAERKARWNGRYRVVKFDMTDGQVYFVPQMQDALGWLPMVNGGSVPKVSNELAAASYIEGHIKALAAFHTSVRSITTVKD